MKTIKTLFLAGVMITLLTNCGMTLAQNSGSSGETVIKEWKGVGESSHQTDIAARIVTCNGVNQVLLNVFNENSSDQDITFTIKIVNSNGEELNTPYHFQMPKGAMYIAKCGDSTYDNLKINLPSNYDPSALVISVTF